MPKKPQDAARTYIFPVLPPRAERRIEPPKDLAPQDRNGFISPNLQSLRDNPRRTREQDQQLRNIERSRVNPIPIVDTPRLTQPSGDSQLAYRNNNPGNLEFRGQDNSVANGRFARFETRDDGVVAFQQNLRRRVAEGNTIESFISKYAPAFENDTEQYISQAEKHLGASRSTPLNHLDFNQLSSFMLRKESSSRITGYVNPLPRVNQDVPADNVR